MMRPACLRVAGRARGGVRLPSRIRPGQPRCARPGSGCLAMDQGRAGRRLVIAIDGKAARGAKDKEGPRTWSRPWAAVPSVSAVSTDHGRRARRTIKAVLAPAWIEFDGAAQVAPLRRTVTKNGKKTVEVVYLITSDLDALATALA